MTYTAKQIAKMIRENVKAVDQGRITWEQFGLVNRATWELADRGELCIIGSRAARFCAMVSKELRNDF